MPKLFISHASEDKDSFVRPLAETLKEAGFGVWYDEYELTLGDSLRAKIDHGLSTCDYGVVVLSHAFFSKDWPQRELDGLFALEVNSRKIILPLWYKVTKADVLKFSPILAGRLGGRTDEGFDRIVEDIRRATNVSARSRELESIGEGSAALATASAQLTAKHEESKRMNAFDAGDKVTKSANQVSEEISKIVEGVNKAEGEVRFKVVRAMAGAICVEGPYGLTVCLDLHGVVMNSADHTQLRARYGKMNFDQYGHREASSRLDEINFKPRMVDDHSVLWDEAKDDLMTPVKVADHIIKKFAEHVVSESG